MTDHLRTSKKLAQAVEKIVDVGEIRFSQRSIKRRFQESETSLASA